MNSYHHGQLAKRIARLAGIVVEIKITAFCPLCLCYMYLILLNLPIYNLQSFLANNRRSWKQHQMRRQSTVTKKRNIILYGTALDPRIQLIRAVNGTLRPRTNHKVMTKGTSLLKKEWRKKAGMIGINSLVAFSLFRDLSVHCIFGCFAKLVFKCLSPLANTFISQK